MSLQAGEIIAPSWYVKQTTYKAIQINQVGGNKNNCDGKEYTNL